MSRIIAALLPAALLLAGAGATPCSAQGFGDRQSFGREQFERGYRQGRADERDEALRRRGDRAARRDRGNDDGAAYRFSDPWFSYGYGIGDRDSQILAGPEFPSGTGEERFDPFD